jgi:hypothetical protein
VEADFARRMFTYNYRLFDRYNRPVASFAVLGDDRPGWRPNRFHYSLSGCKAGIKYPTRKLLRYGRCEAELETHANPFATVVLAHLKTLQTRRNKLAIRPTRRRAYRQDRLSRGDVVAGPKPVGRLDPESRRELFGRGIAREPSTHDDTSWLIRTPIGISPSRLNRNCGPTALETERPNT